MVEVMRARERISKSRLMNESNEYEHIHDV